MKQTPMFTMIIFKTMKQIIFLILFPTILSAQFKKDLDYNPTLNIPDPQVQTGRVLEFISYPMFATSGFCAGLSNKFGQIDSNESNRPEIYSVAASAGFVTSAGMWGVGFSLQGKPKWKDLYKVAGAVAFSGIGYYIGQQTAELFPTK